MHKCARQEEVEREGERLGGQRTREERKVKRKTAVRNGRISKNNETTYETKCWVTIENT